jgi:integrase
LDATKQNVTAALAREHEHRTAIREGRTPRRALTARRFSDAAKDFAAWCEGEHRDHPSTARRVAVSFCSLSEHFGDAMIATISAAGVEAYKTWRITKHEVVDVTLRHDLHALSKFFQWAIRLGYAAENPVRSVRIPSDKDAVRIHVLNAAEEQAYFAAAAVDQIMWDIARLLLNQGMRPDELLGLQVSAVDLAAGTAMISKGKTNASRRLLTLVSESKSILARRVAAAEKRGDPWIFQGKSKGRRLSAGGMAKKHDRACEAAGVAFVPYDFRHTFATRLAQAGCDLATLAAILGHSSIRLVSKYVHPTAAHQAAAMRMYETAQIAARPAEVVQ